MKDVVISFNLHTTKDYQNKVITGHQLKNGQLTYKWIDGSYWNLTKKHLRFIDMESWPKEHLLLLCNIQD